jgi:hypothetical protein
LSIQTFSKPFLFSNNKEKLKTNPPVATGPAHGNQSAHGHTWPARPERREGGCGLAGRRPMASLAKLRSRRRPRRRCDAVVEWLGHEAGGHHRPCQGKLEGACSAREASEGGKVARQGGEEEEGAFHGGRARHRHGRWWRGARRHYLGSISRHKREHHVPESEAELLARNGWPRWRRRGGFLPAGAVARRGESE